MLQEIKEMFAKHHAMTENSIKRLDRRISTLTDRVDRMENQERPTTETHATTEGDREDVTNEQAPNNETTYQHAAREE